MNETRPRWPEGKRCAVMLTYDLDGETLFIEGPEGKDWYFPRSVSYGRYGPNRASGHILSVLEKHDLKSTWFIPGRIGEKYADLIWEIDAAGHEIGGHGYDHELLTDYTIEEQREIFTRALDMIKGITGKHMVGFRAPSGDPTSETAKLLAELGFGYMSSMRDDDRPYRTVIDGKESDFIEISAKWEMDDYPQFGYDFYPAMPKGLDRISGYSDTFNNWRREFDGYYKYGLCYVVIMHPQIIGTPGRVLMMEELINYMKSFDDVWFATGSEVADWWRNNY